MSLTKRQREQEEEAYEANRLAEERAGERRIADLLVARWLLAETRRLREQLPYSPEGVAVQDALTNAANTIMQGRHLR